MSVLGRSSALDAKDRIGYLPEERGVYRKMQCRPVPGIHGPAQGSRRAGFAQNESRTRWSLWGSAGLERKRCEELSKGMTQKVQFLAAIIHKPDLLILDEPFSGLDPVSSELLRDLVLAEHRRGATILFSTHVMPHAEELCDSVVMIYRGRKVLDEKVVLDPAAYNPRNIQLDPLDHAADVSPIRRLPGVERVERSEHGYDILSQKAPAPRRPCGGLSARHACAYRAARPRLEDVFIKLVSPGSDRV